MAPNLESPLPWEGQPYSVKRHGVTITSCDTEPVRTPGCVQAHGALLVLEPGALTILQASESCPSVLGEDPAALLGESVAAILGDELTSGLRRHLAHVEANRSPLVVGTRPPASAQAPPLDVLTHTVDGVVVVELEPTTSWEGGAEPDLLALLGRSVARLQGAASLEDLCATVTDEVARLTRHDRVMVYRFHDDGHGEVVAETRRPDLPSWLGLHYPAEDIPRPVREVFTRTWSRPLPDVRGGLAELVPLVHPRTGAPLDMTHCVLRGPSVMYTEYLVNMGVAAAHTLPLRKGEELWGLIACHHYGGPHPVPHAVRAAAELLAQVASLSLRGAQERARRDDHIRVEAVHHAVVQRAAQDGSLEALLAPALLEGIEAGGVAMLSRDGWRALGRTPSPEQLGVLGAFLHTRPEMASSDRPVYATDQLGLDLPAARAWADVAGGILAFPLGRPRPGLMVWFRPESLQSIRWGGNPHDKPTVLGPHGPRLTPRRSFELFVEAVRGRSTPWRPEEIEAALRLRVAVMELVVARAERLADLAAELTRSNTELDAFAYVASHDLKEPLRGINMHAQRLLDDADLEAEGDRRRLDGILRLTLRMNGLLDSLLHFSRVGRISLQLEPTDLNEVLAEALEIVEPRSAEVRVDVRVPRPLPVVACDRVRCREVFVNLLSNAIKYNVGPDRRVEVGYVEPHEAHPRPRCPEAARGQRLFFVTDNGIGIEPRHYEQVFRMFRRLHGRDEHGGGSGVGLTIVRKLVERHHGQVWLDSVVGQGTTFYFTLGAGEMP